MIEIIPNWHPIFVHFTFALFAASVVFYWLAALKKQGHHLVQEFEIAGRWCLWASALITIATLFAGDYAYDTVAHDEPGHIAMNLHRSWAIPTGLSIIVVGVLSWWRHFKKLSVNPLWFRLILLLLLCALFRTAWLGAELVYRHGIGVVSSPGHTHEHDHSHHEHHHDHS